MLSVGSSRQMKLELFPFISLFLCVIGVLAFLQNLLVIGDVGASEEEAAQPQIFQTAYRIESHSDRFVMHPPDNELLPIYESLTIEEKTAIESIENRRQITNNSQGDTLLFTEETTQGLLFLALNEVSTLNRLAKEYGMGYEEYVLLDVHPGGSDAYHYLVQLLDSIEFRHIRSGLDVGRTDSEVAE